MQRPANASRNISGFSNTSCFVVLQGYVVRLGHQSMINSPRAGLFPVKWKNKRLPDGVVIGSRVTIFGKIITLDLGRAFIIVQAETISNAKMIELKKTLHPD